MYSIARRNRIISGILRARAEGKSPGWLAKNHPVFGVSDLLDRHQEHGAPLQDLSDEVAETEAYVRTVLSERGQICTDLEPEPVSTFRAALRCVDVQGDPYDAGPMSFHERKKVKKTKKKPAQKPIERPIQSVSYSRPHQLFINASYLWLPLVSHLPGAFGCVVNVPAEIQKRMDPAMDTYIDGFQGQFRSLGLSSNEVTPIPLGNTYPDLIQTAQQLLALQKRTMTIEDPRTWRTSIRNNAGVVNANLAVSGFFRAFIIHPIKTWSFLFPNFSASQFARAGWK